MTTEQQLLLRHRAWADQMWTFLEKPSQAAVLTRLAVENPKTPEDLIALQVAVRLVLSEIYLRRQLAEQPET